MSNGRPILVSSAAGSTSAKLVTSAPAQKARPAPVRTITRTSGSAAAPSDRLPEHSHHRVVERVEVVRLVQGDRRDPISHGIKDGRHSSLPMQAIRTKRPCQPTQTPPPNKT